MLAAGNSPGPPTGAFLLDRRDKFSRQEVGPIINNILRCAQRLRTGRVVAALTCVMGELPMTTRDELRARAQHLVTRAKASAASCKRLLELLRSMHSRAVQELDEAEAPRLAPE